MNMASTSNNSKQNMASEFFRNLPISRKFLTAFGILFIFSAIIATVTLTGLNRTQAAYDDALAQGIEIRRRSDHLESSLLRARQSEKNFLLKWREEGFETAYANYVIPHSQSVAAMREDLEQLARFGPVVATLSTGNTSQAQYEADIAALIQNVDTYEASFNSLAAAYERKGFDNGEIDFESKFRIAARTFEDGDYVFQERFEEIKITFFVIRRNEKDYLLSQQQQYIDNIHLFMSQLKNQIMASDQLEPALKTQLLTQADIYLEAFDGLVELDREIATYDKDLVSSSASVEELTTKIKSLGEELAVENINTARASNLQTFTTSIVTVLIVLAVSILLAAALSQQLTGPIISLTNAARDISRGKFGVQAQVNSTDEIGTLAQTFNNMTAQLHGRARELEQQSIKLELTSLQSNKRAQQLQTIAEITRYISSEKDLKKLLPLITQTVSEQFGFYHIGIFLLDDSGKFAVLLASNSPGGQEMLRRQHRLEVGQTGIVGNVTATGNPYLVLDTDADAIYFNNPDLPQTRSELALPLKIEKKVIGALDIQSMDFNAFSDEDVEALTTLADQVSLAIQNARLFNQIEKALAESNAIQRQYLHDVWSNLPTEQRLFGYKYSITGAVPLNDDGANDLKDLSKHEVAVPISLRGEHIGVLTVQVPQDEKISPDQIDLIKAVAERVALSAENSRLFDETQKRATQLESLNEMGRVVSQQIELKGVLSAAYEQLKRVISLDAYIIALYDEARQTIHLPLVIDEGKEYTDDEESPLNPHSLTGKVLLGGKPILQLLTESEYLSGVEQTNMLGNTSKISASLMYLPLRVAQKIIGVLSIQSYTLNAYTQDQVTLVENIANQLSIAIQNARLFEEANRRAERERIISEITSKIGSSVRTENILKTTAKELNQFFDGAEVLIRLTVDEQQKENPQI
jgi:GAF domain-containing protein/HAMP domain-containing protein